MLVARCLRMRLRELSTQIEEDPVGLGAVAQVIGLGVGAVVSGTSPAIAEAGADWP